MLVHLAMQADLVVLHPLSELEKLGLCLPLLEGALVAEKLERHDGQWGDRTVESEREKEKQASR